MSFRIARRKGEKFDPMQATTLALVEKSVSSDAEDVPELGSLIVLATEKGQWRVEQITRWYKAPDVLGRSFRAALVVWVQPEP